MKKIALLIYLSLITMYGNAQTLQPEKSTIEHKNIERPCLLVKLDPEPKTLKNAWIDYLKKEYDFKLRGMGWFSNKDLLHAEKVTVQKLSPKKLDFYTYIIEDENGSEMKVFASFGYDIYLNEEQYPVEFRAMNDMIVSFLKEYLPEYYNKIISESAERVKDLNKEISSLKEDINDNNSTIEKLTKEIEKYKVSVEDNSQRLKSAENKLIGRQDKLERVKTKLQQL